MSESIIELPFSADDFGVLTFDCYGTLIDWESGILHTLRPLFMRHGLTLSDNALLELFARHEAALESEEYMTYRDILRETVLGMAQEEGVTLSKEEAELLPESVGEWNAFPDTVESLRRLGTKYRLAILSNIDDTLLLQSAEKHLGGSEQFETIVTAQQVRSYKPSPPHFTTALERLGVQPEHILHIAQSRYHDIAPASALGLKTVWVNRRRGQSGTGATAPAVAQPDLEVPNLQTLTHLLIP
jgi:2-haloacid dehalogenase